MKSDLQLQAVGSQNYSYRQKEARSTVRGSRKPGLQLEAVGSQIYIYRQ